MAGITFLCILLVCAKEAFRITNIMSATTSIQIARYGNSEKEEGGKVHHAQQQRKEGHNSFYGAVQNSSIKNAFSSPSPVAASESYVRTFRGSFSLLDDEDGNNNERRNSHSHRNRLSFVHVPKTGGTSIEAAGGGHHRLGLRWGSCAFESDTYARRTWCPAPKKAAPTLTPYYNNKNNSNNNRNSTTGGGASSAGSAGVGGGGGGGKWPTMALWHTPPSRFPLAGVDPYLGSETFAVVRDVYDVIVSEFYWRCRTQMPTPSESLNEEEVPPPPKKCAEREQFFRPEFLNRWVRSKFDVATGELRPGASPPGTEGHLLPQSAFVLLDLFSDTVSDDGGASTLPAVQAVRMVDHTLRFEHLSEDFARLADAYYGFGCGLRLNDTSRSNALSQVGRDDGENATAAPLRLLTANDFDGATLKVLNLAYADDFRAFGFTVRE